LPTEDLSIIIPWCNRDTIGRTLPNNIPALDALRCTAILVNCGGNLKTLLRTIPPSLHRALVVNVKRPFNKSLSNNIGLAVARTSLVCVVDADIVFSSDYFEEVARTLTHRGYYVTGAHMQESEPRPLLQSTNWLRQLHRENYLHFKFREGREVRLRTYNAELVSGTRAGVGLIAGHRVDFEAVGGFNSDLTHWGWEDLDIQIRLMHVLGLKRKEVGTVLHLTHHDDTRNLGSLTKEQANAINMNKCLEAYNQGNFQGTYDRDIQTSYNVLTL
jgi:hypothetical protein